jgi:hypothetical protein
VVVIAGLSARVRDVGWGESLTLTLTLTQAETTIPARQQRLVCNGRELAPPTATLASVGVTNGDLIMLLSAPAAPAPAPAANPAAAAAATAAAAQVPGRNPPGASRIFGLAWAVQ